MNLNLTRSREIERSRYALDRRYALLVDLVGISNSFPLKITTKLVWFTCMLDSVLPFVIQVAIQPVDIYNSYN